MALTKAQSEAIDAYIDVGSYRGAARKLGKAESTIRITTHLLFKHGCYFNFQR